MVLQAASAPSPSITTKVRTNHESPNVTVSLESRKTTRNISFSWIFPIICGILGALAFSTALSTRSIGSHLHRQIPPLGYQSESIVMDDKNPGVALLPMLHRHPEQRSIPEKSNMCVPGGGFSGFWFTLGQLQSLGESKSSYNYYCYSAGCLCVAAFLADLHVEEVLDVSLEAQALWQNGNITRFQVVPYFVDKMIDLMVDQEERLQEDHAASVVGTNATCHASNTNNGEGSFIPYEWMDSLRIITGVKKEVGWGLDAAVRTPTPDHSSDDTTSTSSSSVLASFRKMLLQTVWIPIAIGDKLFLDSHIDGAFVRRQVEDQCQHSVDFVYEFDLIWHSLNTNLSKELAISFLKKGRQHEAVSGSVN